MAASLEASGILDRTGQGERHDGADSISVTWIPERVHAFWLYPSASGGAYMW
jgi:hypothetical protein